MLSESQKNYIDLVLLGGEMTDPELREYLTRSGWSETDASQGLLYVHNKGIVSEPTSTAGTVVPISTNALPGQEIKNTTDSYKEIPTINERREETIQSDFNRFSSQSAPVNSQTVVAKSTPKTSVDGISPVMTMPTQMAIPKNHGVLKFFVWFLFLILIILIAGVVGYMYYTHTGFFTETLYTKTNV